MDKQLTSTDMQQLFERQLTAWDLLKENYAKLSGVEQKQLAVNGLNWQVQFNPARARSSAAKVDKASIAQRPCFLCPANLPPQQEGLPLGDYQLLVNPYPILPEHFTIPVLQHIPQQIKGRFTDLLQFARQFSAFTWFYNGPKAGASAPDHMHFQAGTKGYLPVETGWRQQPTEIIYSDNELLVCWSGYMFVIETAKAEVAGRFFRLLYDCLPLRKGETEPSMNLVVSYQGDTYTCFVFPREKHRPDRYFKEGKENMLISPGVVDVAGILVVIRDNDFTRISATDIREVMDEVILNKQTLAKVISNLKEKYPYERS